MRLRAALFSASFVATCVSSAFADTPYVVLTDDGTIEEREVQTGGDIVAIQNELLALYEASGMPLPEIMSVWTTFPFGGSNGGTYFDPLKLDVTGIGLESVLGGDGTLDENIPPLRSILFHNNINALQQAATRHRAPLEGYAEYLFLLELSHNWGPALQIPDPGGNGLVGFPFHWSFYMDAGGSPAGGSRWIDNGDGTFTVDVQAPGALKFNPVDLYVMGLLPAAEVPDFGLIEDAVAPATPTDPLWGGVIQGRTFPWFDATSPVTVTGTRRVITIEDVVAANGERAPVAGAKTSFTLGIVLLVSKDDDPAAVDAARATFAPIADSLAPAFATATDQKGTLDVVTNVPEPTSTTSTTVASTTDASSSVATTGAGGAGGAPADEEVVGSGCSCRTSSRDDAGTALGWFGALAAGAVIARRRARASAG